jgi:hypothetical protein
MVLKEFAPHRTLFLPLRLPFLVSLSTFAKTGAVTQDSLTSGNDMQVPRHREIPIPSRGIRTKDQSGLHLGRRQGVPERPDPPASGPGKEE